jgi:hypothetical protein
MQKWEYLDLTAQFYSRNGVHCFINGQNVPNPQTIPNLYQYINQLGEDGWELVNSYGERASSLTTSRYQTWVFKRPKP